MSELDRRLPAGCRELEEVVTSGQRRLRGYASGVRGLGIARSASTYVSPVPYRKREQYSDDERGWDASNTTRRVYALRSELYCK